MGDERPFEPVPRTRPGDEVLRRRRRPRRRLRIAPDIPEVFRILRDIVTQTPLLPILSILLVLFLLFTTGLYFVERGVNESLDSYGEALWWSIAAMQTMGSTANQPITTAGKTIGGIWAIVGTMLFFGAVIASVTAYFIYSRQRPSRQIIATVQYNLGRLEELSLDELEVLKETTDGLIDAQIGRLKQGSSG
ncbi:MAG: ion channel [Dehalococcoidia bacterium]